MTRFARATGSKASNERVAETATSWQVMKNDLKKAQDESNNKREREKMNELRQKSYDDFINETEAKVEKKWAEFPVKSTPMKAKQRLIKKKIKVKKHLITENEVTDEMIDEFIKSDEEQDSKVEDYKKEIEEVLKRELAEKSILNKSAKKNKLPKEDDNVSDDGPEETTTKFPPLEIIVKKKKDKIKKLKKIQTEYKGNDNEISKNDGTSSLKQANSNKGKKTVKKQKNRVNDNKQYNNKDSKQNIKEEQNKSKLQQKKVRDDKEHKRRKPDVDVQMWTVNGKKEQIFRYEGFPVLQDDFIRLTALRKSLISKGIPQSAINRTMQLERRKAEKYLARIKKQVCFNCRKSGHMLSACPDLNNTNSGTYVDNAGTGICFKCGSTEHNSNVCKAKGTVAGGSAFKFAHCFICREQGHIAKECPDNPRGLYPNGGACKACGDVTHLKKDCPKYMQNQQDKSTLFVDTISGNAAATIDALDGDDISNKTSKNNDDTLVAKKIVKF